MNAVDDRNAIIQRDPLERVSDGTGQIVRVIGLSLQNDAEREDHVRLFLLGQLAHHDRNFKCTGDSMKRHLRQRRLSVLGWRDRPVPGRRTD